jgi:uncharacterized RDD family membrane protein YckC
MTCPVCGKASPCVHGRRNTSALLNPDLNQEDLNSEGREVLAGDAMASSLAQSMPARVAAGQHAATELAWREEVASRVQQHRARRRRPVDPKALELDFSTDTPHFFGAAARDHAMPPPPERFAEIIFRRDQVERELDRPEPPKIIRFPRTQPAYVPTVEEVTLDELELADPAPADIAPNTPRILEAADPQVFEPQILECQTFGPNGLETEVLEAGIFESGTVERYTPQNSTFAGHQMELLPSFADIRLEPEEARIEHDFEIIPHPAPLNQRFVSGLVDAGIVFIATAVFVLTFVELAEEMPQSRMAPVCMLAAGGIFWLLFQYIFLAFRRATPGMTMAQLELCTFAGTNTSIFERQRRALASTLSVCAMGLGFAWALVDEDRLGWHDRISGTHLRTAISTQPSAFSTEIFSEDVRSWGS